MSETIFKRERKERNYTVLDNTFIKDVNLSWKAKGLMTYLLSLPDTWEIHLSELQTHATDGRDSLQKAIKELVEKGYLKKEQTRNEKGIFQANKYIVIENPLTDIPSTENPPLLNTNRVNTKELNTDKEIYSTSNEVPPAPKKPPKHIFGEYKKVRLTDEQLQKLKTEFGEEKTNRAIQYLDEYKTMSGKKYADDNLVMRKWVFKALEEQEQKKQTYQPYQQKGVYDHIECERTFKEKLQNMTNEEVLKLF